MRATALALIGLLCVVAPAVAGEATGAEILEYGLYTADIKGQQRDPNGVVTNVIENICHVATTTTVPMRQAVHFGFRYTVDGPSTGELVDLTLVVQFPAALQPSAGAPPVAQHEHSAVLAIGATSYTGYSFDQDWEFVPGTWTLEVRQGSRTLAEKSFTVVDHGEAPASSDRSSCFKVSSL